MTDDVAFLNRCYQPHPHTGSLGPEELSVARFWHIHCQGNKVIVSPSGAEVLGTGFTIDEAFRDAIRQMKP